MGGVPGVRGRHRTQDHLSAAVGHPASPTTGPVAARRSVTGVKPLDPRLLRHAATARGYLALAVGLGLAEDEHGTCQAQPDSQGEVDPGGRRMAQQPRVERLHARHATSGRHWSRGWAGRMAYRCAQVVLGAVAAANSWYAAHARGP